jgi:CHAT domain-containing protein
MKGKRTSEPPVDRRQRRPNPRAVNAATRRRGQNASVEIVLTQADVDNAWLCRRYQLTPTQFKRWQSVVDAALKRIDRSRCPELDESFWTALRDALFECGATEREIHLLTAAVVRFLLRDVAEGALVEFVADVLAEYPVRERSRAEVRAVIALIDKELIAPLIAQIDEELIEAVGEELLEPIAQYLARTDITIHFGPAGCVRHVEFPERWVQ